jgi:hypothetical protein
LQETTKVRPSPILLAATGPKAGDDRTHSSAAEEADNYCSLTVWHFIQWVFWGSLGGAGGSMLVILLWPNETSSPAPGRTRTGADNQKDK